MNYDETEDWRILKSLIDRTIASFDNSTITIIKEQTFSNCNSLTSVNIPNVRTLSDGAFYGCRKLSSIYLPSVSSIGSFCFSNCIVLKRIEFGENFNKGGNYAYNNIAGSAKIVIRKTSDIARYGYYGLNTNTSIIVYVPDSLVEEYKSATNWSAYANRIKPISELPEEETT